ncbi:MAG TPA: MlaD family protein [Candidatus Kryptobacter bacterium]|nr:MlaD family protein [Candidatus Kryptobacter bacterium]
MKLKRNEFMIGLSISIAAAIVIFTILWLGKSNFFMKGVPINLMVQDANGITSGDEVFYRGLKVGNITDASITKNAVLLKLKIEDVDNIPVDSRFEIGDFSLISGKAIEITPGTSSIYLAPNDTVRGSAAYGMNQAVAGLQALEAQVSTVLSNVDTLTGHGTRRQLDLVLTNLNETITQLNAQVNGNLKQTLTNVNQITSDNKDNIALLTHSLSDNSKQLSAFLKTSSKSAEQLDSLLTYLNEGKGSVGSVVKSDSLYKSLNSTISSIDSLVDDIKSNPKKYVNVSVF